MNYTAEEKTRIRHGWQCPDCFGPHVETRGNNNAFQCQECGSQWLASQPQFKN